MGEFKRDNCDYYYECRLPLDLCNATCKKYELGDWVKLKKQRQRAKELSKLDHFRGATE